MVGKSPGLAIFENLQILYRISLPILQSRRRKEVMAASIQSVIGEPYLAWEKPSASGVELVLSPSFYR